MTVLIRRGPSTRSQRPPFLLKYISSQKENTYSFSFSFLSRPNVRFATLFAYDLADSLLWTAISLYSVYSPFLSCDRRRVLPILYTRTTSVTMVKITAPATLSAKYTASVQNRASTKNTHHHATLVPVVEGIHLARLSFDWLFDILRPSVDKISGSVVTFYCTTEQIMSVNGRNIFVDQDRRGPLVRVVSVLLWIVGKHLGQVVFPILLLPECYASGRHDSDSSPIIIHRVFDTLTRCNRHFLSPAAPL